MHKLKTLVLLLMLALLPVRALAAVTSGFCAFTDHHGAAAAAGHSHGEASCSFCVEHCSSAAFAPSDTPPRIAEAPAGGHSLLYQRSLAGFIPDPLDPPPLAA
ncbi:MAG TPA: hypothetical protein VF211_09145 [Burkholderiales bacterium]